MNTRCVMARLMAPLFGLALLIFPATAQAQYFGRNKVQYEHFDFKVLQTDHFNVYFYPNERAAADIASRMAERWYTRLSSVLRHQLRGRQPLILYAPGRRYGRSVVPRMTAVAVVMPSPMLTVRGVVQAAA